MIKNLQKTIIVFSAVIATVVFSFNVKAQSGTTDTDNAKQQQLLKQKEDAQKEQIAINKRLADAKVLEEQKKQQETSTENSDEKGKDQSSDFVEHKPQRPPVPNLPFNYEKCKEVVERKMMDAIPADSLSEFVYQFTSWVKTSPDYVKLLDVKQKEFYYGQDNRALYMYQLSIALEDMKEKMKEEGSNENINSQSINK